MQLLQCLHGGADRASPAPQRRSGLGLAAAAALGLALAAGAAEAAPPPLSFADLAAKVSPAVVNISSSHVVTGRRGGMPGLPFEFPPGSPFEEFFKKFRDQQQQQKGEGDAPSKEKVTALGSGFILDPTGYVVTNNHVVDQATDIQVTLTTGEQYAAKLIGTDPKTDLALLKISADKPLPAVGFGDSDATRVGDWVMAVGNPFGLGGSVTVGVISARGRDIHSGPFDDFLQVDASINQGNSGGPTFNMDGQVIGINTAIATPNGGSVGIGFAIPSNMARPVIDQLRAHGTVERGWLGVQIQKVTPEIASAVGLKSAAGALVAEVQPNSPASRAKVKQGDIILGFNGKEVAEMRDLPRLVAAVKAGTTVDLTVWRNRGRETLSVEIGKLKEEQQASASDNGDQGGAGGAVVGHVSKLLGAKLASLTPKTRQQFNIADDIQGVLVTDVDADGPAADQGLRPGDVIQEVGQAKVDAPKDVDNATQAAREAKQPAVLILVNRGGDQIFVAIKLGQA
ncbi:MAG: DegQ family serine endoprotease [Dongiaceae bacterium]